MIDKQTRVLIQGITGKQGRRVSMEMLDYGTHVVAGVTPGKGGQDVYGVPVYDSRGRRPDEHPEINTSLVSVPREGTQAGRHRGHVQRQDAVGEHPHRGPAAARRGPDRPGRQGIRRAGRRPGVGRHDQPASTA